MYVVTWDMAFVITIAFLSLLVMLSIVTKHRLGNLKTSHE